MNERTASASPSLWVRIGRYLLIAVVVFLVVSGVSAVAVPLLIDHVVLARVGETLGRRVLIDRIRFNPFTLALSAKGIRIRDQAADADFVIIESVQADLSISSVRYLAPVIDRLKIVAPRINLQRTAAQRFNFSDIVERLRAETAQTDPDAGPVHFALHNLEVDAGEIALDDQVLQQKHLVKDLRIGVPFVSNLDYATDITVQPELSAVVNDSPLHLTGRTVPFSDTRETSLELVLDGLDIATYLRLSPVPLAFTVPRGKLGADLTIGFSREAGVSRLIIAGSARIDDLQIDARDGNRQLVAGRIALELDRLEPIAGRYAFGALDVDALDLTIEREADGGFPIARVFAIDGGGKERGGKEPAGGQDAKAAATKPIEWSIRKISLKEGHLGYTDASVSPTVELDHSNIAIELAEIGNQQAAAAPGTLTLTQNGTSKLTWQGELDLGKSRAAGRLHASVASIAPYLPYFADAVQAGVEAGPLEAQAALDLGWADEFTLALADGQASVQMAKLRLPGEKEPAVAFGRLAAEGIAVALGDRRATVARLELTDADIRAERNVKGELNLAGIVRAAGEENAPASQSGKASWSVTIDRIDLDRNAVHWRDLTASKPVSVPLTQLAGRIEHVGTDRSLESKLDLKAKVGRAGTATARGEFVVAPWSMQVAVQLQRFALASIDPYVAERLTIGVDEGVLSTSGELRLGGDRVRYRGRLDVDGLRTRERTTSTDAVSWKKLRLEGIDVDVDPATLGPDDRIAVGAITLSDFFAKVVLTQQGRFNLQDIIRTEASMQAQAQAQAKAQGRAEARSTPDPQARAGPTIRLGAITLERGRSNFTDRFVRPNYTLNLSDLNGSLSAMASGNPAPAKFALKGRVDGDAPIDISGKIDPLGPTLYADIRAEAKGIDLPALSPYSAKYAGYAIEKGKLSLDVHYKIENGRLEAQNHVRLLELTFGEKIDSPDATKLPVQFAVGLLKNSEGVIDVNLPIAGSLDDPQFSIGDIIGKAISNLLIRVITAPFSALASAFGGGGDEELSFVEFEPGTARLTQESLKRLGTIAKALTERPALKLEIAGRVDPQSENDAIERRRLRRRLQALKLRQAGDSDAADLADKEDNKEETESGRGSNEEKPGANTTAGNAARTAAASVTIGNDEYPVLLKQLYDATKLADKPRNALGLAKEVSVAQMESLLLGAIKIGPQAVRTLASRRAQTVREWLATEGGIAGDRMFVLAPRTSPDSTGPNQSKPQCSASCAEFSLR